MESFVTLSWSTAGSARRRWGWAWGRCAWCGWGGDDLEVVHRAHCHRLRVEANQSNRSLTPQPQYQLQVDWDGKSPTASHRSDEEKETKQSWQKLTFGVVAAISESAVAEKGGEAVSKTFPKAFQNIPSPRQQLFSFNLQTSAWSTWLSCYCQIIQTFPISPNPGSMITKAFWQTYWLIFFHYQLQPPESLNKCPTKHQDRGASSLTNTLKKVTLFHFLFNMGSVETCNINK